MFILFSGRHGGTPTWRFHTGLCKFLRNISTNIWSLGKRTGLKLGEVSYFVSSITSQFLSFFHWIVFDLFFYCVTVKTIYMSEEKSTTRQGLICAKICLCTFSLLLPQSNNLTWARDSIEKPVPGNTGQRIAWFDTCQLNHRCPNSKMSL